MRILVMAVMILSIVGMGGTFTVSLSKEIFHGLRLTGRLCHRNSCTRVYSSISGQYSSRSGGVVTVPSGLIAVYKPQDWTSSDVVGKVRNILRNGAKNKANRKGKVNIKVGHGGTLDPLAEGVLVLGIGEGTKMLQSYLTGPKSYYAEAKLGAETDTLDSTGKVTSTQSWSHVSLNDLDEALEHFRGNISQVPPMYSALKRGGKKLYDLARKGIEVEREPREVTIYELKRGPEAVDLPMFSLDVTCSGGTYIRTLCADIARRVNSRAHMTRLLRTRQGLFTLEDCVSIDRWDYENLCHAIIASSRAKEGLPDSASLKVALKLDIEPIGES